MDEKKQPGIHFKNVIVKDLSFSREPAVIDNCQLDFKFGCQKSISEDRKKLVVLLEGSVKAESSFDIKCSVIGFFEIDDEAKNMSLEQFAEDNAPALLFPYLREVISTTTLKAGMNPVFLPPINIRAYLKALKKE